MSQRVKQEQESNVFDLTIERRCQRSSMNGIEEEKALTTSTKTISLELILRNSLIKKEVFDGDSIRIRNAYNLRSILSCLL
jgi:hypothetical protein